MYKQYHLEFNTSNSLFSYCAVDLEKKVNLNPKTSETIYNINRQNKYFPIIHSSLKSK